MFGLSFWKILLLVVVVLVLFFGYRLVQQRVGTAPKIGAAKEAAKAKNEPARATDLVHCKTCDSFVPSGQRACGRARCPYPA